MDRKEKRGREKGGNLLLREMITASGTWGRNSRQFIG